MSDKTEADRSGDNESEKALEPAADHENVDVEARRVKFYSVTDMSVGLEASRAAEIAQKFDAVKGVASVGDALELANVIKFIEAGLVPDRLSEEDRSDLLGRVPMIRRAVASFFRSVDESNVTSVMVGVPVFYRIDLLDELARQGAFERCQANSMLSALQATGFVLRDFLNSKALVKAYGADVRSLLLSDPLNGEILVQKYLAASTATPIYA
ncbi:hypothetical protein OG984_09010 [Nocardioides sp. NBC_00368]|uniref:hypothetical protein n=1 Tax=Nocardioides sp. NBC_00368 TaxID=2976000 RepID=UPI002E1E2066